jgi:hypothetical protein
VTGVEVFNPKFDELNGVPVVTWREGYEAPRVATNLYNLYLTWKSSRLAKHEPTQIFWDTNGPAIVRALTYVHARALVIERTGHDSVAYRWFGETAAEMETGRASEWRCVSSVSATGTSAPRVLVRLASDEDVEFVFSAKMVAGWLRSPP